MRFMLWVKLLNRGIAYLLKDTVVGLEITRKQELELK